MKTVISQSYYSTQSDSSISANLHATWGNFGGGGSGGASTNTTDQKWQSGSTSATYAEGGDPSIKSFNSPAEWSAWAKSVETGSPVITSVALQPISAMIPEGPVRANLVKAVAAYASNQTYPAANLTNYTMGWCDCEYVVAMQQPDFSPAPHSDTCFTASVVPQTFWSTACPSGKVATTHFSGGAPQKDSYNNFGSCTEMQCCRPCFTAKN